MFASHWFRSAGRPVDSPPYFAIDGEPPCAFSECIGTMNLWRSPSPVVPTPSPPVGERDGVRGCAGSWTAPVRFSRVHWDHEPVRPRARRPPRPRSQPIRSRPRTRTKGWFMGSPHDFFVAHWDHKPIGQFHVAYATRICPSALYGSWVVVRWHYPNLAVTELHGKARQRAWRRAGENPAVSDAEETFVTGTDQQVFLGIEVHRTSQVSAALAVRRKPFGRE